MIISRLVPTYLKKRYFKFITNRYHPKWLENHQARRLAIHKSIPLHELEQKHIRNLKVLLNRQQLLEKMPAHAICAEIGVDKGDFSEEILKITDPAKLHLIDMWGDQERYHDGLKLLVEEKFKNEIDKKKIEIKVGLSTDVLKAFPDHYFDWVYLDTAHTYDVTAAELLVLKDKVKDNGIIAGHDYIIGNWNADFRYGVIEAVHEFCVKQNWELIYVTWEANQYKSFAIRKIAGS
jgi:hypothetical protein